MWRDSAALLRRCLAALAQQSADQLVVSRSSEADFSEPLRSEFPDVIWVEHPDAHDLPELQWHALPLVQSEVAAFLEAPSIPGPGWVSAHRQAHLAHPEVLACGGPVRPSQGARSWALGWHWSDYAAYTPGRPSGPTRDLTDANVSYKMSELLIHKSMLAEGAWGWHIRNAGSSPSYYDSSAWIEYRCPDTLGVALNQRCSAGRNHGALRRPWLTGRALFLVTAPVLPLVLTWRGWQQVRSASYLHALPWILVFHLWWTCGEAAGTVTGRHSR